MDYINTYPSAYIRYYASEIVLDIASDDEYLVAPQAQSWVAGYFRMKPIAGQQQPLVNGTVLAE